MKLCSPLTAIAAVFILASILRLIEGNLHAIAAEKISDIIASRPMEQTAVAVNVDTSATDVAVGEQYSNRLQLARREKELELRMADLDLANQQLDRKLALLQTLEATLAQRLSVAEGVAENDVAQLVSVYSSMKPATAAKIFSQMTPSFAAGLLARAEPAIAAAILGQMPAEAAHAVSVTIAGQHSEFQSTPVSGGAN